MNDYRVRGGFITTSRGPPKITPNPLIVAQRKLLNLKQPFEIKFDTWGEGNALYEWYNSLADPYIQTMQLRKERKKPVFHEFIAIRLKGGTCWRIERWQPNTLVNRLFISRLSQPVSDRLAYDTVEEVTSLESTWGGKSDCLVEFEFNVNVRVGLILRICHAIKNHQKAKFYTVENYNCYFFAQALLLCTVCGISDWTGVGEPGERERSGLWKSPNAPVFNFTQSQDLGNKSRLATFRWNPSDNLDQNWDQLSRLSNALVHASPLLQHADHCNHCIESQSDHRQRSLSSEINRLKHELVEYWNSIYREVLAKVYLMNHRRLVDSGAWGLVPANVAAEDCKQVLRGSLDDIRANWESYSRTRVERLIVTVQDILEPTELCDAWRPEPLEWESVWACNSGGSNSVQVAMADWEREIRNFIESEIFLMENTLKKQAVEAGTDAQEEAILARLRSLDYSMNIKIRISVML
ncbi:unnamed protein product [Rhizoctonia solani]|uniref:Uncharacterized protein n=1 Tax=Rhizoctonia solani TaxID=456999 RepID=A0A8H3BU81_9AGAM|nr:unnamed protein product [Rhizoctonia solani]CAE6480339.1 unnamed protein product [Rhizoctonia solani]